MEYPALDSVPDAVEILISINERKIVMRVRQFYKWITIHLKPIRLPVAVRVLTIYEAGGGVKEKMATQPPLRRSGGKEKTINTLSDL
jgi:hypothetical protein